MKRTYHMLGVAAAALGHVLGGVVPLRRRQVSVKSKTVTLPVETVTRPSRVIVTLPGLASQEVVGVTEAVIMDGHLWIPDEDPDCRHYDRPQEVRFVCGDGTTQTYNPESVEIFGGTRTYQE